MTVCVCFNVIIVLWDEMEDVSFETAFEESYEHIESINSTVDQNYTQGWIDATEYMRSRYMYGQNLTLMSSREISNLTC